MVFIQSLEASLHKGFINEKHTKSGSYTPKLLINDVKNNEHVLTSLLEELDKCQSFIFSVAFLKEYLPQLSKSSVTGEYYMTSLVDLAVQDGKPVETVQGGKIAWRGVNTKEDLLVAESLYKNLE